MLWRTFLKGQVRRIDFDTNDARLFADSGDGWLRAFDLDGNKLWETWVDSWLPSIDISTHYILASSKAARQGLHLIDKATGTTIWSYQVETIASNLKIAPDESFAWYGAFSGAGYWLPSNSLFTIGGLPVWQLTPVEHLAPREGSGQDLDCATPCRLLPSMIPLDRSEGRPGSFSSTPDLPKVEMSHIGG